MSPTSLSSILPAPPKSEDRGPRLLVPPTNAIPLISAKNGWKYSLLHTASVMALFVLQFRALVANPYRIMILDLGPLMLLQCAYCVSCLPPTGTWSNTISSSGNETAGSGPVKTSKGSVTGSLRKRPVGVGRAGASSAGGIKGKLMVYIQPVRAQPLDETNRSAFPAHGYCSRPDAAPPTDPINSPHTHPRRSLIPNSADLPHSHTITTHLAPHLFPSVLHARRLRTRMARCYCCMDTIRRSRCVGRERWMFRGRLVWGNSNRSGLGPRLAGVADHCIGRLLCGLGCGQDIIWACAHEGEED